MRRATKTYAGLVQWRWYISNPTRTPRVGFANLLADDSTWERKEMLAMTQLSYPFEPEYLVRWEAWHVLEGWGYDPPEVKFARGLAKRK